MRIVQINSVVNTGSTGKIAEAIGKEILRAGGSSCIAYGRSIGSGDSQSELYRIGNQFSNFRDLVSSRFLDNQGFNSTFATKKLLRFLEQKEIDLLHLHNLHGYYLHMGVLLSWAANRSVPIVLTLHDCWTFTGHCAYYDLISCEKWRTGCHSCPQTKAYPKSFGIDNSKPNFERKQMLFHNLKSFTTVAVSNWLNNQIQESTLKPTKKFVVHNGVNLDIFMPYNDDNHNALRRKYGMGKEPILLGVANVWDTRKGLNDLISVSKSLNTAHILVLIGLTQSQIDDLPDGIYGLTRTENQIDLSLFYSAADVYVNPTYEDNFPTTNIEALACGTPVITYNTGGSPEAICERSGKVVPVGNIEALKKAVKKTLGRKEEFTGHCVARAKELFDEKKVYKKYIEIYEDLISR